MHKSPGVYGERATTDDRREMAFFERFIAKDFDGIYELVTDDFSYKAEPKSPVELGLGNTDGVLNKAEHKAYCAIIAEGVINFNVSLSLPSLHFKPYLTFANL